MPFNCVLVGQGALLIVCAERLLQHGHRIGSIVSSCPQVGTWARKKGAFLIDPSENLADMLGREPFDYLFSIVNHVITPEQVLALPRLGAINYHDSVLPTYSGFNASAWAVLDGQREHGVTWHRMTADVDAGAVLLQKTLPISEDEITFSLSARLSELAGRSFADLLALLEGGTLVEAPARPAQNFHFKSDRPGFPVLDWTQPASQLLRMVRAFDFGTEDNWMTRAKLQTLSGDYLCVGSATRLASLSATLGTLGRVSATGVEVNAADGALLLSELTTLDGQPIRGDLLGAYGLIAGATLAASPPGLIEAAQSLDREVTKTERFWLHRLQRLNAPELGELEATLLPAQSTASRLPCRKPLPACRLRKNAPCLQPRWQAMSRRSVTL